MLGGQRSCVRRQASRDSGTPLSSPLELPGRRTIPSPEMWLPEAPPRRRDPLSRLPHVPGILGLHLPLWPSRSLWTVMAHVALPGVCSWEADMRMEHGTPRQCHCGSVAPGPGVTNRVAFRVRLCYTTRGAWSVLRSCTVRRLHP